MLHTLVSLIILFYGSHASPISNDEDCGPPKLNNLTSPYTLTAFAPFNQPYNGLKVNNLNLFQATVYQYCPFTGNQSSFCPNGTDMAFAGSLYPVSLRIVRLPYTMIDWNSLSKFPVDRTSMSPPMAS